MDFLDKGKAFEQSKTQEEGKASEQGKAVPEPTIRRLPVYHSFLVRLKEKGRDVVSCTHIADDLKLDPTQVRKDLAFTGIAGKPKVGYLVNELMQSIEHFLGWDNVNDAFLVGAGHLGTALLGYPGFATHGVNIVAAFDNDPIKIGRTVHGKMVLDVTKLPDLVQRMHVKIGIITTPGQMAQSVADLMTTAGIIAIWNFTTTRLDVPEGVIVETDQLFGSLAILSSKLVERIKSDKEQCHGSSNGEAGQAS